jgi:hypothetical protein
LKEVWDWISYVITIYESVAVPFNTAFKSTYTPLFYASEAAFEVFFILDIGKPLYYLVNQ